MSSTSRYADWKAPDQDGQFLLWPDARVLLLDTRQNHARLSNSQVTLQNVPLAEVRRAQRQWLGHTDDDQPLIANGHQTELYHPGVWAKDALINAIARNLGGQAWHLGVDTDSPKHLHLRWPGGSMPITDDSRPSTAAWTGLLDAPTPAHVDEVRAAFNAARASWDFEPMAPEFLATLRSLAPEQPRLPEALTTAIHKLDWSLGMHHHALLMAPVWGSEAFLVFAHHVMARPAEFAAQYNAALAEYRTEQGIHSPGRPMPDLQIGPDEVESPFWFHDLEGDRRERLCLRRAGNRWALRVSDHWERGPRADRLNEPGESFVFDPAEDGWPAAGRLQRFLRERRLRVAPRALTLTMFFRLLLADQFVHGIGGGRYDQVTDKLIERHFGIEAPRFSVTTATLYFPAARGQKRVTLRPLLQEGRRLRHGSFSREKRETAERIAALPRRSIERRELFYAMHGALAAQASSPGVQAWNRRLEDMKNEQQKQRVLFDRELFFAIQPAERLHEIIARYDAAVGAV
jgi:hypothetical protein